LAASGGKNIGREAQTQTTRREKEREERRKEREKRFITGYTRRKRPLSGVFFELSRGGMWVKKWKKRNRIEANGLRTCKRLNLLKQRGTKRVVKIRPARKGRGGVSKTNRKKNSPTRCVQKHQPRNVERNINRSCGPKKRDQPQN